MADKSFQHSANLKKNNRVLMHGSMTSLHQVWQAMAKIACSMSFSPVYFKHEFVTSSFVFEKYKFYCILAALNLEN